MQVIFKIPRQKFNSALVYQEYIIAVEKGNTILECLNKIKWELDGSLAFRKNCRNTICGSCAIKINGTSALACKENVGRYINGDSEIPNKISLAPLANLPIIKDLVVDMQKFWGHLESTAPFVQTSSLPDREFLQSEQERAMLNQTSNCISCGACYSECNAKIVNDEFIGPHALVKAQRLLIDSRDISTDERLKLYSNGLFGVWGCTRCYQCNVVCPMEVEPMEQIGLIKQQVLQSIDLEETIAVRHRRVLIDLVKQGGWIDERRFAILVLGNSFKDIKALLKLFPLGIRMVISGKFPFKFRPSQACHEVSALIESVKAGS
jgi:succinate dehydrogenase / fumarate reductase iron-sulfur subunit